MSNQIGSFKIFVSKEDISTIDWKQKCKSLTSKRIQIDFCNFIDIFNRKAIKINYKELITKVNKMGEFQDKPDRIMFVFPISNFFKKHHPLSNFNTIFLIPNSRQNPKTNNIINFLESKLNLSIIKYDWINEDNMREIIINDYNNKNSRVIKSYVKMKYSENESNKRKLSFAAGDNMDFLTSKKFHNHIESKKFESWEIHSIEGYPKPSESDKPSIKISINVDEQSIRCFSSPNSVKYKEFLMFFINRLRNSPPPKWKQNPIKKLSEFF